MTRPEGKVAAANAVLPYLARVPNAMLRAELANRLAERLRLESRLLVEELKRAAGARGQPRSQSEQRGPQVEAVQIQATPAEKKLLRAFFDSDELAGEFLPKLVDSGTSEGLATEKIFRRLSELHAEGERLELAHIKEWLEGAEQRLVYESVMEGGEAPDVELVEACILALERRKSGRERERLQAEIRRAEQEGDRARLNQLLEAKAKLMRPLERPKGP
jgi:DNA primase